MVDGPGYEASVKVLHFCSGEQDILIEPYPPPQKENIATAAAQITVLCYINIRAHTYVIAAMST
jgi:hypothetical protein